ncbi:uncharacterized protein BJ212DRAFT_1490891 [Suillus subaureus]|uniref:Uncharacterized protein n=1 Tax=Suillus subaureus TaxID=48587 RepID=A0A9P7AMM8_9AGAM|nr:uncharacterized protein BJ212DRAFT_1490891 [Suillus subaureus]KAG1791646.1 hypothetical protein BJ212DRAFT_1490891 [Suillus subaureus]
MTDVLGVLVIARNGDRTEYYQDPKTYESSYTESTALGVVQSHQLGSFLRSPTCPRLLLHTSRT